MSRCGMNEQQTFAQSCRNEFSMLQGQSRDEIFAFECASQSRFGQFQAEAQAAVDVLRAEIAEERAQHVQQLVHLASSTPGVPAPDMNSVVVQELRVWENTLSKQFLQGVVTEV